MIRLRAADVGEPRFELILAGVRAVEVEVEAPVQARFLGAAIEVEGVGAQVVAIDVQAAARQVAVGVGVFEPHLQFHTRLHFHRRLNFHRFDEIVRGDDLRAVVVGAGLRIGLHGELELQHVAFVVRAVDEVDLAAVMAQALLFAEGEAEAARIAHVARQVEIELVAVEGDIHDAVVEVVGAVFVIEGDDQVFTIGRGDVQRRVQQGVVVVIAQVIEHRRLPRRLRAALVEADALAILPELHYAGHLAVGDAEVAAFAPVRAPGILANEIRTAVVVADQQNRVRAFEVAPAMRVNTVFVVVEIAVDVHRRDDRPVAVQRLLELRDTLADRCA